MGFYKWSRALVFSGDLHMLDDSNVCACVRSPKSFNSDVADELEGIASDNVDMLVKAIAEKKGLPVADDDDSDEQILNPMEKLVYIPRFGYLLVNLSEVGVDMSNGDKQNALVATRCVSLKGKKSNFYLFVNEGRGCYSGKIGKNQLYLFRNSSDNDKVIFHFIMISYQ